MSEVGSPSRQLATVVDLGKCMGCQTCTIACKGLWTGRPGSEHMRWASVATCPGAGYPKGWEEKGGGFDGDGNPRSGTLTNLVECGDHLRLDHDAVLRAGNVDAAAVMFPLVLGADPLTMGSPELPVNMWYWKADDSGPFDVIARGYATSQRRPGAASGLRARGAHASARWQVVLQRILVAPEDDHVALQPGDPVGLAFALWQGSNGERAGQKSVTPRFLMARLER